MAISEEIAERRLLNQQVQKTALEHKLISNQLQIEQAKKELADLQKPDIIEQQSEDIEKLLKTVAGGQQPVYVTQIREKAAETKSPNYLMYIAVAVVVIFMLKRRK